MVRGMNLILSTGVTVLPMTEADLTAVVAFWRDMPGVGLNEGHTAAGLRLKVLQRRTTTTSATSAN